MSAHTEIVEFVLEAAGSLPLTKRAKIYRNLAVISGCEADAVRLNTLAENLDAIERKHQQLVLDFRRAAL